MSIALAHRVKTLIALSTRDSLIPGEDDNPRHQRQAMRSGVTMGPQDWTAGKYSTSSGSPLDPVLHICSQGFSVWRGGRCFIASSCLLTERRSKVSQHPSRSNTDPLAESYSQTQFLYKAIPHHGSIVPVWMAVQWGRDLVIFSAR